MSAATATANPIVPITMNPLVNSTRALATRQSAVVRQVAGWIVQSNDHRDLQFIIIDKANAQLFLFDDNGTPRASTPVLVGLARGDDSPPGIGTRALSAISPAERITPAGRFESEPGEDVGGKDLVWIDYNAAIALHRVSDRKPGAGVETRLQRLAMGSASARHISLGCVNVSTAFYDRYIAPTFGTSRGVVYILPATRSAAAQFNISKTYQYAGSN